MVGRLTKDPELKFTSGKGTAVTTFTLAVDEGYGEKKITSFIPIVVWGKGAESTVNYTHKGSKVLVQGRISTRSYEKDGVKHYVTEVVADNFNGVEFLDPKGSGNNSSGNNEGLPEGFGEGVTPVDDGGDIPF